MTDPATITGWHAHVYFDPAEEAEARALCETARDRFGLAMGRVHPGPVGPHPTGSCQLSVPPDRFGETVAWLALNRGTLTVFAHAETGDEIADHTAHVLWLGESRPLRLYVLRRLIGA